MDRNTQWSERLHAILEGALYVWRVEGDVVRDGDDACVIRAGDAGRVVVERVANDAEAPYWEVSADFGDGDAALPSLPYAGIHGMLRAVRALLDPDGAAARLVVGAARE